MTKTATPLPPTLRAASLDELEAAAGGERPELWSAFTNASPAQRDQLAAELWRSEAARAGFADAAELGCFLRGLAAGAFGNPRRTEPPRSKGEPTLSNCTLAQLESAARLNAPLFADLRRADSRALDQLAARLFADDAAARSQLGDRLALRGWLTALGARACRP